MDERIITDFFDHLIPEGFTRPTSARRVELVDSSPRGPDAYDDWVRERLLSALYLREPDGEHPWFVLWAESREGTRWRWHHGPCCPTRWVIDGLRHELLGIDDPWLFAFHAGGRADGLWQLPWYAEARGRGVADVRAGALDLRGEEIVGSYPVELSVGFPARAHDLLRGHPARRRARLRRRR